MSNEDPCLHFEAKLVPDLRTKIKKRLIAAICDLKQPWQACVNTAAKNSRSYHFNYKGTFGTVLLALVDADYKLIYVDIGCNGRVSDGGVYRNSTLFTDGKKYFTHPIPQACGR